MEKVNIGIIGCGRQASKVFVAISELTSLYQVKMICDVDNSKFENILGSIPYRSEVKLTNDYLEVLKDDSIDAILIFTPTYTHIKIANDALKYKKDILLEKPIGLDIAEIDEFILNALKSKQIVQFEFPYHYAYYYRHMRYLLSENALGKTKHILIKEHRSPFMGDWFYNKSKSGGAINDKVIHFFDISNEFFFPSRPVSVFASGSQHYYHDNMRINQVINNDVRVRNPDIVDCASVVVRYSGGELLNVDLNMYQKSPIEGLEINATTLKGEWLKVNGDDRNFSLFYKDKEHKIKSTMDNDNNGINHPGVKQSLMEFYKSVKRRTQPSANLWLAREAQVIALAAEESVVENKVVNLDQYRNSKIDILAKSKGMISVPSGERHSVIINDEPNNDDYLDKIYKFARKIFPKKSEIKYRLLTKSLVLEIVGELNNDSALKLQLKGLESTILVNLPWIQFLIQFSKEGVFVNDVDNEISSDVICRINNAGYRAIITGKSIVAEYLLGNISVEGNFETFQKKQALLFHLVDKIRSKCIL